VTAEKSSETTDWAASLVDNLDKVVNAVKGKTSDPLLKIVKFVLLGFMVFGLAITTLLMFVIGLVRLANNYIPGDVWAADLIIGLVMIGLGLVVWRLRKAKTA
jgi:hypothetical protein